MNLTYFRPKMRRMLKTKKSNLVNIRFVDKTSDQGFFKAF